MIESFGLAMVLVTSPPQAVNSVTLPAGWEHIEPGNWMPTAIGNNSLVLTQPARPPGHIWVRFEDRTPDAHGNLSSQSLEEFDGPGWRTRVVQVTAFRRNNLQGEAVSGNDAQPWLVPSPGTIDEAILKHACGE
jgi:hypothetical protein